MSMLPAAAAEAKRTSRESRRACSRAGLAADLDIGRDWGKRKTDPQLNHNPDREWSDADLSVTIYTKS
jgi:hypothetical protein